MLLEFFSTCFWNFKVHSNNKPFLAILPFFSICKISMFCHFLKFNHLSKIRNSFQSFFFPFIFLHRITLIWLNSRSFYVFGTLECSPKQFTFVLMHHIFINRDCKAVYKILVQWVCNYVQSAKVIVDTRFQCRNAGLVGYIKFLFLLLSFF